MTPTSAVPVDADALFFPPAATLSEFRRCNMVHLVRQTPAVCRASLKRQHRAMVGDLRAFLSRLGRVRGPDDDPMRIVRRTADWPSGGATVGAHLRLSAGDLQRLSEAATTSYVPEADGPAETRYFFPRELLTRNVRDSDAWDATVYDDTQRLAIAGPVHVLWDAVDDGRGGVRRDPVAPVERPPVCVSVAGINFAYGPQDQRRYLRDDGTVIDARAVPRMRLIWYHCLAVWKRYRVDVPVVAAIGCGAFRGDGPDAARVPLLWADALAWVLATFDFPFEFVAVSLPAFGSDDHFQPFVAALQGRADRLRTPVLVTRRHGMVSLAVRVGADLRLRAGILNPSDIVALQSGKIGMFWDAGHVALEEVLAVQTTVLLQHRDLSPHLYDRRRLLFTRQPAGTG